MPVGVLPYVADFEADNALVGSDFDPSVWEVVTEGGENLLIGQARLNQPLVLLGNETPEWLQAEDFVVSFRVNLTAVEGARLVFRFTEGGGYNVLEVTPGNIFLKRGDGLNPLTDRLNERFLDQEPVAITTGQWNEITVWVEGARLYVYLNKDLIMSVEDLPPLPPGRILLQGNNAFRAVRFDDLIVQRAEAGSDHFQGGAIPGTWNVSSTTKVLLRQSGGNGFIYMDREANAFPTLDPMRDFELRCRIWSVEGGFNIYLRESLGGGSIHLQGEAGNLTITQEDAAGGIIWREEVRNFYTRGLWQDLHVLMIEDRLEIYLDGNSEFEDTIENMPSAGTIRFETERADIFQFDDCLITRSDAVRNIGADFAFDIIDQVNSRQIFDLRSDIFEFFADQIGTRSFWVGGANALGEFANEPTAIEHQNFLRMTHRGLPTFRLLRSNVGVGMFGPGNDRSTFRDSTDLLINVDVRLLQPGEAWLGIRTTPTITGNNVNGYRLALRRETNGDVTMIVDYQDATTQETYYEGPIPGAEDGLPRWIELTAITFDDQLAFFANGRFLVVIDNAVSFGGTMALGVEEGTSADFDDLEIRDTSPLGSE